MLNFLGLVSQTALAGLVFYGGFSRFTHGQYTPAFYRYQLERAPDNVDTLIIPIMDVTVGTLILYPKTRKWGALFCALAQGSGMVMRLKDGLPVGPDLAIFLLSMTVFLTPLYRRE